ELLQSRMLCAIALGIGSPFLLVTARDGATDTRHATTSEDAGLVTSPTHNPGTKGGSSHAIQWSQIGASAGAAYKGDGLAVVPTAEGARLRCVFQRLEGEATREGLWLTSTVTNGVKDRFRVVAAVVGRPSSETVGTRSTASQLS